MRKRTLFLLIAPVMAVVLGSCRHEATDLAFMPRICYTEVASIYSTCLRCHSGGEMDFTNYAGIMQGITAGKPLQSRYYNVLGSEWSIMPPDKPLSLEQRTKIRLWIEQGADSSSCLQDSVPLTPNPPPPVQQVDTICFNLHIEPMLLSSCGKTGCHDATTHQGDIVLTSYTTLMSSGIVRAGSATSSKIMKVIYATDPEDKMPPAPNPSLTSGQIADLTKWINQGAVNSTCTEQTCDTTTVGYSGAILSIINTNCKGCHSVATASNKGVVLTSYSQVKSLVDNGMISGVINHKAGYPAMPPSYSLTGCELKQFDIWIASGAPNN